MDKEKRLKEIQERHEQRLDLNDDDVSFLLNLIAELEEENLTLWCQNNGLTKALRIYKIGSELRRKG